MNEITCWADTETKSLVDLKSRGTAVYAEDPSTDIQLFSYAFDEGPVSVWSKEDGEPMPYDLKAAFANPNVIFWFHNAWFDRSIIENVLKIKLPIQRYRCSMAMALSHGLPASLDKLGEALGIREDARKVKDGKRLVLKFCKPKKLKDGTLRWYKPQTDPDDWARYIEYCRTDTAAMREIVRKIPKWNYPGSDFERKLWFMDQTINSRGMLIDLDLANSATEAIADTQKQLAKSTNEMTDGEVETAGQRDAMLEHILTHYGIELADMQKATIIKLKDAESTPQPLRELLQVRLSTCTTSSAKYKGIVRYTSKDSRIKGTIQFAGASRTLRDGGRTPCQPQNLPSRGLLAEDQVKLGITALKYGIAELVGFDVMHLASSALRYLIAAKPDHKLVVSDLSNIEGRVLSYLAGEQWKLDAFADFDAGMGDDLYKLAYAKAFCVPVESVTKDQRQNGKILELACGYGGGVGAFVTFALSFGINLDELADVVTPTLPDDVRKEAESFYDWLDSMDIGAAKKKAKKAGCDNWQDYYEPGSTLGLPRKTHIAVDCLKRLWRRAHPATVKFWKDTDDAVRKAISVPNVNFHFGKCYARRSGKWVRIVLPSGHNLCYPGMHVNSENKIMFKGVDQYTRKWQLIGTYGPRLVENMVQGFSRDIFKFGQLAADGEGYSVILPVHDELVCEVPNVILPVHDELVCQVPNTVDYTVGRLEQIMATVPPWANGLPLAAKGFEDYRYHK